MMYLWPTSGSMADFGPQFGVITTPGYKTIGRAIPEGRSWGCDNEAFTKRFDPVRYMAFLEKLLPYQATCLFVSIPDVVGNAIATLYRWRAYPWWQEVRELGYPTAFVAQDGAETVGFPPADQWDWLFVGGTTQWKLSPLADYCIQRAQGMGKRIHIGRINSKRRLRHFEQIGADTCDGTGPTFGPDQYKRLLGNAFQQHVMPLYAVPECDRAGES